MYRSGYCEWEKRTHSARAQEDERLKVTALAAHVRNRSPPRHPIRGGWQI